MEIFDRSELDIVTAVFNAMTQEQLAEEGETFLKRCGQGISLGMFNLCLRKKNKGWHPSHDSRDVIDTRDAQKNNKRIVNIIEVYIQQTYKFHENTSLTPKDKLAITTIRGKLKYLNNEMN